MQELRKECIDKAINILVSAGSCWNVDQVIEAAKKLENYISEKSQGSTKIRDVGETSNYVYGYDVTDIK